MHPNMIDLDQAVLLVIDYQEGYRPALHAWDETVRQGAILIRGADALGIPILYTEQYPQGVGATCDEIKAVLPDDARRFEKLTMSAWGAPGFADHLTGLDRRHVIVAGIETHACINQTTHDLLHQGFKVHLPVDTLSSRAPFEHEQGLSKMLASGALATSVEQALLECVRSAENPDFKTVRQLIK